VRERTASARGLGPAVMSGVEPMEGALGRTSFAALTGGGESRPWQGRMGAARQPSGVLHWSRAPENPWLVLSCDRERQRHRYSVSLSQPNGAEGLQPTARVTRTPSCAGCRDQSWCGNPLHQPCRRKRQRELRSPPGEPTQGEDGVPRGRHARLVNGRKARQGEPTGALR